MNQLVQLCGVWVTSGLVFMPVSAFAEAKVIKEEVQVGVFKNSNGHLCEAKIYKPVVSGISENAAKKINQYYDDELRPEEVMDDTFRNHCEGVRVSQKEKPATHRSYDFKVTFNKDDILTINSSFYDYEEGMAHGLGYDMSRSFNTRTGEKYTGERY